MADRPATPGQSSSVSRRGFLATSAGAGAAVAVAGVASAATAPRPEQVGPAFAKQVHPALDPTNPNNLKRLIGKEPRTLHLGSALQCDLTPKYADAIPGVVRGYLAAGTGADGHPLIPGAVVLAARDGDVCEYSACGYELRYADHAGNELPRSQWLATRKDTIYDLASLSKLFTTIVSVQLIDAGVIDIEKPVVTYLPAFASHGKGDITIRQLMTHTSGLPPDPSPALWTYDTYAERIAAILDTTPTSPPGTVYLYSDINFMTMALVCQQLTGKRLDVLVREQITEPLHMVDTMYNPPARLKYRIAAEEYELVPDRGLCWGVVHDENAWALGGVAGHAGVFSTAKDLAILLQTILNGGFYGRTRILTKRAVVTMLTNYNQAFPGNDHGLGFELYQHWYMGAMATPYTFGHTGFTGTSVVADAAARSFVILLANAVHPSRDWGSTNPVRRDVADELGRAVAVHPLTPPTAWYSGMVTDSTATLTLPIDLPAGARLRFGVWFDTEPDSDFLYLEGSTDGSTWRQVTFSIKGVGVSARTDGSVSGYEGRQWLRARADLSSYTGQVQLRWRYTTDPLYVGRGCYVDDVTVHVGRRRIFGGRTGAFQPVGWVLSRD